MTKHLAAILSLTLGLITAVWGQAEKHKLSETGARTLSFFAKIEEPNFDDYLRRVRLPQVAAAVKAEALRQLATVETFSPSEKTKAKLATLMPILKYHERDTVMETKIINLREAFVGLRGRSVLLISQAALSILLPEELQAAVAHELGHEYFWRETLEAQRQKQYELLREIELRSDAIAIIALHRLGVDAKNLISAITKVKAFNIQMGSPDSPLYPLLPERTGFIRAMSELVRTREAMQ